MAAEKKELLVSCNCKALGFEPWTLGSKSALPLKPYFPDHSSIPQENVSLFLPRHPVSHNFTQNETAAAPYHDHDVLVPVFYDCCIGAEPTPSHIQSANIINKRMVLLKLNLFILNINSSPFSAMLFLIPSMPLLTNQLLISPRVTS